MTHVSRGEIDGYDVQCLKCGLYRRSPLENYEYVVHLILGTLSGIFPLELTH